MTDLARAHRSTRIIVENHAGDGDPTAELRDIRRRLERTPPEISPKYFYDDHGSDLFERICELPEYYQTRTERSLLERVASEIVGTTDAAELVELGSGASTKTRVLLDAIEAAGRLRLYVPLDVNEAALRRAAGELVLRYPDLHVHGVVGDFLTDLGHLPGSNRRSGEDGRLVIFLGSTIGNLEPREAVGFLGRLATEMTHGSHLLLGVDLIKDTRRLEAAYNDAAGLTARFNLNLLRVINRRVGGDFDPAGFEHHAFYNEEHHRIEMWLRSTREQRVHLTALDLELAFPRGHALRTEISVKWNRALVENALEESGFSLRRWDTDPEQLFALALARRQ